MNDSDSLRLRQELPHRTAPQLTPEASAAMPPGDAAATGRTYRRYGPLGRRLADQGLFLFRHRSAFAAFLVPIAVVAVLERRAAGLPADPGLGWFAVCLTVSLLGLAVRWAALGPAPVGASTRSLRAPSASVLNKTGMYSLCRHPVYLGNLFVLAGFAMALKSWWFVLTAVLVYWLLYERVIAAEERFLAERFGAAHRRWAERTPTFWPRPGLWAKPDPPFSWRTVFLREYDSLLLIASVFLVLRMVDQVVGGLAPAAWLRQDLGLVVVLLALAVLVSVLRQVRRRSRSGH